jgi:hypothetical protein
MTSEARDYPYTNEAARLALAEYRIPCEPLPCVVDHEAARMWSRVDRSGGPDSCWVWLAYTGTDGYGRARSQGRQLVVHRVIYQLVMGVVLPPEIQVDHLCRNRSCVNPVHLEPVTASENLRRADPLAYQKAKTHCPSGHAYDEQNTRRHPRTGGRTCRACHRDSERRRRAARIGAVSP